MPQLLVCSMFSALHFSLAKWEMAGRARLKQRKPGCSGEPGGAYTGGAGSGDLGRREDGLWEENRDISVEFSEASRASG